MKKWIIVCTLFVLVCSIVFYFTLGRGMKDGIYEGSSQSYYISEPYHGIATVTVQNQQISHVDFKIVDKAKNEVFDETYGERNFKWSKHYMNQCRNDWKGLQAYIQQINETRNPGKVDAIAGATWSYNIFIESVREALKKAR